MKKTFFTFCSTLLFLSTFCFQSCDEEKPLVVTGNIEGTVINLETQENLSGANVVITSNSATTFTEQSKMTGSDGKFSFKDLEAGSYKLSFSKDGYDDNSKNINLIAGQTSSSDVSLKPIKSIINVTPILLDFGQNTNILPIEIQNTGKGELNWTIVEDFNWLSVNPVSGKTTTEKSSVSITVDRTLYNENIKTGLFSINSNGGSMIVNVIVGKPIPELNVKPTLLDFGMSTTILPIEIRNTGNGDLNWTIVEDLDWLSVNTASGKTTSDLTSVSVTIDRSKFSENSKTGTFIVNSNGGSAVVTVKVSKPIPELNVTPIFLDFGISTTILPIEIRNKGNGELNWTVVEDLPWLSVNPVSGKTIAEPSSVSITVDRTLYNENIKTGLFSINSNGGSMIVNVIVGKPIPELNVKPTLLDFGMSTTILPIEIRNTGNGDLNWTIVEDLDWLSVNTASGKTTSDLTSVSVTIDRSKFSENSKTGTFIVNSNGGSAVVTVKVSKPIPELNVTPIFLDFGISTTILPIEIRNKGNGELNWTVVEDLPWLSVNPVSGKTIAEPSSVSITVDRTLYNENIKTGLFSINSNGGSMIVNVIVGKPIPELNVKPTLLDFGTSSTILPIEIRNSGNGELSWTIAEDLPWMSVNPVSGKTSAAPSSVSITVDRDKLTENSKIGSFVINSNGGSVVVNLTVSKAGPILSITPATLDFGGVETEKSLNVQNIGVQTLTYEAKATQSWITLENPQGSTTTQIKNIKVTINRAGMSPGDYSGSINVNSNSNPVSVPVTMKVSLPTAPEVLNGQASGITSTAAQVSGNITSLGSSAVTQHGHCWSTSPNPTTANNKTTLGGTSVNKSFVSNLSGLSPNTSYYVKAYATNSVGTTYSDAIELTTLSPPTMATVKTLRIENVTHNAVDGVGELTKLGDGFIIDYGFCYSSSNATPTLADSKTSLGSTTKLGEFTGTISGLRESTKYFVRAYATNSLGTAYGSTLEQTTKVAPPLLTTGLLAYYNFDNENCNDYLGEENYHGIVQGTGTDLGFSTDIPGVTGKSLKGSAGGKYYKLLKAPDYSANTTTIMSLMKTKINGSIYYRGYFNSSSRGVGIENNLIKYNDENKFSTDVSMLFLDGGWHHIAVVYSSSNVILYIDGRYIETRTTYFGNYGANESYIGNFTGLMDNLRLYNRALTQDEVKQIFNAKQ